MNKIFSPQDKVFANIDRVIEFVETGNAPPVLVEIDPSNICPHNCSHCISGYIHSDKDRKNATMDRTTLMALCHDLVEIGVRSVNITGGGEPAINKHLKDAIIYLGSSGVKQGMFTNGVLLNKIEDFYRVILENLEWIRFSIDAGCEETYNSVRKTIKGINDFDVMLTNLCSLLEVREATDSKTTVGVGFVITEENYEEILMFAEMFSDSSVDYCQYKPEIVNVERNNGVQREVQFWKNKVEPLLSEAKEILGSKFQLNSYKLDDLINDPVNYGRTYIKCIGSQLQPCVGADGEVYVCTNHRGHLEYSYGNLKDRSFIEIWNDVENRKKVMELIERKEKFSKCTKLCKAH